MTMYPGCKFLIVKDEFWIAQLWPYDAVVTGSVVMSTTTLPIFFLSYIYWNKQQIFRSQKQTPADIQVTKNKHQQILRSHTTNTSRYSGHQSHHIWLHKSNYNIFSDSLQCSLNEYTQYTTGHRPATCKISIRLFSGVSFKLGYSALCLHVVLIKDRQRSTYGKIY